MADICDVIVIGSGHNGLVAAAYLARAGLSVEVLERNPVAGGAVATEELTDPGFLHDTFSSWHPLFKLSPAFAELGDELGIQYCETEDATTANVRSDGTVTLAYRDAERTAEGFDEPDRAAYLGEMQSFGETIPTVGQLFGVELFSGQTPRLGWQLARQLGVRGSGGPSPGRPPPSVRGARHVSVTAGGDVRPALRASARPSTASPRAVTPVMSRNDGRTDCSRPHPGRAAVWRGGAP